MTPTLPLPHRFVAVADHSIVWGTGDTRMAALEDARRRLPAGSEPRLSVEERGDADADDASSNAYAAVADDGAGSMVWGVGATRALAREDARRWLPEGDARAVRLHPISAAEVALIVAGRLAWPIA